jgi:hypothetical protein
LSFEPFTANGHRYCFIRPGDPIGIELWTEYQKLEIVVGTGRVFESIVKGFKALQDLLASDKPFSEIRSEAILTVDSYRKAILDMSSERVSKAFYLCSIFIYREGDDPHGWTLARAETYIADWTAERMSEQDFFLLSMLLIQGFSKTFSELSAEAAAQAERLSVVTGFRQTANTSS